VIEYNPKEPLISFHVPRCGGTSFERILKQWFGPYLFLHYYNPEHNLMPKLHSLKHRLFFWRYKYGVCIHGHFNHRRNYGVLDYYPYIKQYISIVRDPFDLHVSNYFFSKKLIQRTAMNPKRNIAANRYDGLNHYLKEEPSFMMQLLPEQLTETNYQAFIENHFVFIGVLEDYQRSIDILADRLNKPRVKVEVLNKSPYDETIADEENARKRFREKHSLEYKIYDLVKDNVADLQRGSGEL